MMFEDERVEEIPGARPYCAGNLGGVYGYGRRPLRYSFTSTSRAPSVVIKMNGRFTRRSVAKLVVSAMEERPIDDIVYVGHRNGDPEDCRYSNLIPQFRNSP